VQLFQRTFELRLGFDIILSHDDVFTNGKITVVVVT
jgi:hypothetical protein